MYSEIIISILKANLIALIIVSGSYLLEKVTGVRLLIDSFTWEKSPNNAHNATVRDTVSYFILNLVVFIVDVLKKRVHLNIFNAVLWISIVLMLVKVFNTLHSKYQAVDPNKQDDDYT
jgi:hypothetical protein